MNTPNQDFNDVLRGLKQTLSQESSLDDEVHITDDLAFVHRWSMGALTAEEQQLAIQHLINCRECRTFVGDLIEDDIADIRMFEPAARTESEDSARTDTTTSPTVQNSRGASGRFWLGAAALAASLVLIVTLVQSPFTSNPGVAMIGDLIASNRFDEAYAAAKTRLESGNNSGEKEQLEQYLKSAGDELLANAFAEGSKQTIRDISDTYKNHDIRSASSRFYEIASDIDATNSVFTDGMNRIDELFDVGLSGKTTGSTKSVTLDDRTKGALLPTKSSIDEMRFGELASELADAVEQFPNHIGLRLNYAHVLLAAGQNSDALVQFTIAANLEPQNANAIMGRGLAEFQLGQYEKAEQSFAAVSDGEPHADAAKFNRAIVLRILDQRDAANQILNDIVETTSDPELRDLIQAFLVEDSN